MSDVHFGSLAVPKGGAKRYSIALWTVMLLPQNVVELGPQMMRNAVESRLRHFSYRFFDEILERLFWQVANPSPRDT